MYPPKYHQSQLKEHMLAVAEACPFGMLLTAKNDTPYCTHLPILLDRENDRLLAHIDAQNPQCKTLIAGASATIVFKGPDTYISPDTYSTSQLPTWNYIIAHARGTLGPINDPEQIKELMVRMTEFLEDDPPAYRLDLADPRMDRLIPYIHAFEITELSWEGKFKLSQDKNREDQLRAKDALLQDSKTSWHGLIEKVYSEFM